MSELQYILALFTFVDRLAHLLEQALRLLADCQGGGLRETSFRSTFAEAYGDMLRHIAEYTPPEGYDDLHQQMVAYFHMHHTALIAEIDQDHATAENTYRELDEMRNILAAAFLQLPVYQQAQRG
ncbi:MAG TPA: hypothetical protein PLO33_01525 [Kouleothrix sp.]|uniref:hypothetical protein n=1 Tax=Kouleothrix sp. TaxID=2779161 RepID=UPI002C78B5A8|nr:hypothetical protein [Kouleothrix sp.]HRC74324.1 hypothetical protein [Kouleothrix sp.]